MKTLDSRRKQLLKYTFSYMLIALFCVIFGAVYERFGHGIYSYRMIYAFAAPLVLGAIFLMGIVLGSKRLPGSYSLLLWNCGIATLTIGLLFHGVLDIYGTTSRWVLIYYIVSGILLLSGILFFLIYDKQKQKAEPDHSCQKTDA